MAIHIENSQNCLLNNSVSSRVQNVPFKISADCDAKVSKYFETSVKQSDEGDKFLKASFRGFPLKGQTISLPDGYIGVVLHESIAPITDKEERRVHIIHKFKSLRYWNWDKVPSKNDKVIQALEWVEIAEALHSPITED